MSVAAPERADLLVTALRLLCAQPASAGHDHELAATADLVASALHQAGFAVAVEPTPGAPVVLGWRAGRSPYTLLLYHHYDVAPPGPWRDWAHEPFQLAERDGALYGRGVGQGKGPFLAHLNALQALLAAQGDLPCGVVFVVEGEGLSGSPHLAPVLERYRSKLRIDACLSSSGERDTHGLPFCYSGSKGLLRVQLRTHGPVHSLPGGMATTVHNPIWRLTWALSHIKGEDEDVRISGFYDAVEGPSRSENAALRQVRLDEAGRLKAWQLTSFLFEMNGVALVRAEATLPTCNLTTFTVTPPGDMPVIPTLATALLDFHLVPRQEPDTILHLLREHLIARNFSDIVVEPLPGGYAPIQMATDHAFIQTVAAAGQSVFGTPLHVLPLGPFVNPLALVARCWDAPVAALGVARPGSARYGPNEHVPLDDLLQHGQVLLALCNVLGAAKQPDTEANLTPAHARATMVPSGSERGMGDAPAA